MWFASCNLLHSNTDIKPTSLLLMNQIYTQVASCRLLSEQEFCTQDWDFFLLIYWERNVSLQSDKLSSAEHIHKTFLLHLEEVNAGRGSISWAFKTWFMQRPALGHHQEPWECKSCIFFSLHFPCPPNLMLISSYNELLGACRLCSLAVFSIFVLQ